MKKIELLNAHKFTDTIITKIDIDEFEEFISRNKLEIRG